MKKAVVYWSGTGNTEAMAKAAMEWIRLCLDKDFRKVVVSLKASNTVVMTEAYRKLASLMKEECSIVFPMHLGVTEAGNGDAGRIKSCVKIRSAPCVFSGSRTVRTVLLIKLSRLLCV